MNQPTNVTSVVGNQTYLSPLPPPNTSDPFFSTIVPQSYAISGATILCVSLFVLLFLSKNRQPVVTLIATCITSALLIVSWALATNMLEDQWEAGNYSASDLSNLSKELSVKILTVISQLSINAAQIRVLMQIFPRRKERKILLWIGATLCIIAQVRSIACILNANEADVLHD